MTARWILSISLLVGCGFGDNGSLDHAIAPDAAVVPTPDAPDAPSDAPTQTACTLVPQGGCTSATPACDVTDDGNTACRAVTTQGTSNSHCASDSACKAGYTCTGQSSGGAPWCARFCIADGDCTGTGSRCLNELDSAPLDVKVCTNACDPYARSGCPSGMACNAYDAAAGSDYTDCIYGGTNTAGQSCASDRDCVNGTACVGNGSGASYCRKWCVVGNSSSCATGQQCTSFVDPITIGTVQYGACQ